MATFGNGRRVAIVAGVRTPFAKAGTAFKSISAIDLGKLCVAELLQRTNLDGKEVQALVFGTVIPSVIAPNIAREVSLLPLIPKGVQAYTVSRACASANQAITAAVNAPTEDAAKSLWAAADKQVMADAAIFPITNPLNSNYHAAQVHNAIYLPTIQQFDPTNVWIDKDKQGG